MAETKDGAIPAAFGESDTDGADYKIRHSQVTEHGRKAYRVRVTAFKSDEKWFAGVDRGERTTIGGDGYTRFEDSIAAALAREGLRRV